MDRADCPTVSDSEATVQVWGDWLSSERSAAFERATSRRRQQIRREREAEAANQDMVHASSSRIERRSSNPARDPIISQVSQPPVLAVDQPIRIVRPARITTLVTRTSTEEQTLSYEDWLGNCTKQTTLEWPFGVSRRPPGTDPEPAVVIEQAGAGPSSIAERTRAAYEALPPSVVRHVIETPRMRRSIPADDLAILGRLYERMNAQEAALERHARNEGTESLEELRLASEQLVNEANDEFARIGRTTTAEQRAMLDRETRETIRRAQAQEILDVSSSASSQQSTLRDEDARLRRRNRLQRRWFTRPDGQSGSLPRSFASRIVYELSCNDCKQLVCARAMKAILLSDTTVTLFSTDYPPPNVCRLGSPNFETDRCRCKLFDIGCQTCGNVLGYHIQVPCKWCTHNHNNGHFFMMLSAKVQSRPRAWHAQLQDEITSTLDGDIANSPSSMAPVPMTWHDLPALTEDAKQGNLGNPFHWLGDGFGSWWDTLKGSRGVESDSVTSHASRSFIANASDRPLTGRRWWDRELSALDSRQPPHGPEEPDELEDTALRSDRTASLQQRNEYSSPLRRWRQSLIRAELQREGGASINAGLARTEPSDRSERSGDSLSDSEQLSGSSRTYADVVRALRARAALEAGGFQSASFGSTRQSDALVEDVTDFVEAIDPNDDSRVYDDEGKDDPPSSMLPGYLHVNTGARVHQGDLLVAHSAFDRICSHENLCRAWSSATTSSEEAWNLLLKEGPETVLFCINFVWPLMRDRADSLPSVSPGTLAAVVPSSSSDRAAGQPGSAPPGPSHRLLISGSSLGRRTAEVLVPAGR